MRAIDTNVLVRLITQDDDVQALAAERFVATGAWVSHLALIEAVWVLQKTFNRNRAQIDAAIEILLSHQNLDVEEPGTVAQALQLFRRHPKIGFADALMLATAQRAGHLPLGTFDRSLGRVDGAELL